MADPRFPTPKTTPGEFARWFRNTKPGPFGSSPVSDEQRITEGVTKAREMFMRRAAAKAAAEQNVASLRPARPLGPNYVPARAPSGVSKALGALGSAAKVGGGAAGFGELAQMLEPNRRDIGFMGIGIGDPRSAEEQAAHPAALNMLYEAIKRRLQ